MDSNLIIFLLFSSGYRGICNCRRTKILESYCTSFNQVFGIYRRVSERWLVNLIHKCTEGDPNINCHFLQDITLKLFILKKNTASQTHFGFTNMRSEMHSFSHSIFLGYKIWLVSYNLRHFCDIIFDKVCHFSFISSNKTFTLDRM